MTNILKLIYDTAQEINAQLPPDCQLSATPDTIVVGAGSPLDSLGVINFLVSLEERVGDATGKTVSLLDEGALNDPNGPLRTIALLERYICERL
jgi:hypothetical protein